MKSGCGITLPFLVTYKLIIEYDGARFSGWQFQPRRRTVQGVLEGVLRRLFGRRITTVAASRTDAGVHATGQSVSFRAPKLFRGDLRSALNFHLPSDVSVLSAERVNAPFHARNDVVSKTYEYRLVNRPSRPVLLFGRASWVSAPLNLFLMRREAKKLLGRNNFSQFSKKRSRASRAKTLSPFCRFRKVSIRRRGDEIIIEMTADRFLYRMARRIAGHLVHAGLGKATGAVPKTLESNGLCLRAVHY